MAHKKSGGIGTVVAAVVGAVVGAGMAVVGGMALTNKKTHKEVKHKLMDIKHEAVDYVREGKKKINKVEKIAER